MIGEWESESSSIEGDLGGVRGGLVCPDVVGRVVGGSSFGRGRFLLLPLSGFPPGLLVLFLELSATAAAGVVVHLRVIKRGLSQ